MSHPVRVPSTLLEFFRDNPDMKVSDVIQPEEIQLLLEEGHQHYVGGNYYCNKCNRLFLYQADGLAHFNGDGSCKTREELHAEFMFKTRYSFWSLASELKHEALMGEKTTS